MVPLPRVLLPAVPRTAGVASTPGIMPIASELLRMGAPTEVTFAPVLLLCCRQRTFQKLRLVLALRLPALP